MRTLHCIALLSLGIAFCIGCGDSSTQSWETGKPQASGGKKAPKVDEAVSNDEEPAGAESGTPHGVVNPHGGMAMPTGAYR